jgi:leucyl-tRNA synthetase
VPLDIPEEKLKSLILTDEKIKSWIQGKPVKNFIVVPRKIVNIVI